MAVRYRFRVARGDRPSVQRARSGLRLAAAAAVVAAVILGPARPGGGSIAGPSYVPTASTGPTSGSPTASLGADIGPVATTDSGWSVPLERVGGPSTLTIVDPEPTLLRLRLPLGIQATKLRIGRVESIGSAGTSIALAVSVNGIDLEPVAVRVGHPLTLPLSDGPNNETPAAASPAEAAQTDVELRLLSAGDGTKQSCGLGSLALSRITVETSGAVAPPDTLDELLPSNLERLTIVMPEYPDDDVATAALRLAALADFGTVPGLATRIVGPDAGKAQTPANPWQRVVFLKPATGPGRVDVGGPNEVTFTGASSAMVSLVDLLRDPTARTLPVDGLRVTAPVTEPVEVDRPRVRSLAELTDGPLTVRGTGEAAVQVPLPRRVGRNAVGTVQGEIRGLVKADRPVEGVTVIATMSGLTVGTATVDGRSGTFSFPFAVRHLADGGPHGVTISATTADATVTDACPGTLAGLTLAVDPLATLALGPDPAAGETVASAAYELPSSPTVGVDAADTAGLSFAAASIAAIQDARGALLSPRVASPRDASSRGSIGADLVVASTPADEALGQPDVGVQPFRLPGSVSVPTVASSGFSSVSLGANRVNGHRQLVLSAASPEAAERAAALLPAQSWPSAASYGLLIRDSVVDVSSVTTPRQPERFDAGATPPNELGLAWPDQPSSGNRVLFGMGAGAVAVLVLRIIVRTHRTVSRVPDRPKE